MAKTKRSIRKFRKAMKLQSDDLGQHRKRAVIERRTQEIQLDYVLHPEKYIDYSKLDWAKLYMKGDNQ